MKHRRKVSAVLGILMLIMQILVLPTTPVDALIYDNNASGEVYVHTPRLPQLQLNTTRCIRCECSGHFIFLGFSHSSG